MNSDLSRFIEAQQHTHASVLAELRLGKKTGHWMWFTFPQLRGLGHSQTSIYYGISDICEAESYSKHPILGPRLIECVIAVLNISGATAHEIFGHPDELKFISSMTLFGSVAAASEVFHEALLRFNGGDMDAETIRLIGRQETANMIPK
jgi:uncharacterized protein (DUF1810 family)